MISLVQVWLSLGFISKLVIGATHEIFVLSKDLAGSAHIKSVDGITIMSSEYYTDQNLMQTVVVTPSRDWAKLQIKLEYFDLPNTKPCDDFMQLCEVAKKAPSQGISHTCINNKILLDNVCGSLSGLRSFVTSYPGRGVRVRWITKHPSGSHRGFKMIITAFTTDRDKCERLDHWTCDDGRCISSDLHCDSVQHCNDSSDEQKQCSATKLMRKCDKPGYENMDVCRPVFNPKWLSFIVPIAAVIGCFLLVLLFKIGRIFYCFPSFQSCKKQCQNSPSPERSHSDPETCKPLQPYTRDPHYSPSTSSRPPPVNPRLSAYYEYERGGCGRGTGNVSPSGPLPSAPVYPENPPAYEDIGLPNVHYPGGYDHLTNINNPCVPNDGTEQLRNLQDCQDNYSNVTAHKT